MKVFVFLITGILLATVILSVGCGTKATPAPAAPKAPVTGTLESVNATAEGGKGAITIGTPQGVTTAVFGTNTTFSLEGKACTLDQITALDLAKESYNCTVLYGIDKDGYEYVAGLNVTKTFP